MIEIAPDVPEMRSSRKHSKLGDVESSSPTELYPSSASSSDQSDGPTNTDQSGDDIQIDQFKPSKLTGRRLKPIKPITVHHFHSNVIRPPPNITITTDSETPKRDNSKRETPLEIINSTVKSINQR